MTAFQRLVVAAVLAAGVPAVATTAGARETQRKGQAMYDTSTESRMSGTIAAVEKVTRPDRTGRRMLGGLHLTLKTEAESIPVHVGPVAFLDEKKIVLAEGDRIEILGSRVTVDGEGVLLAREIKKGDKTWTLRDASGRPLWSGGPR